MTGHTPRQDRRGQPEDRTTEPADAARDASWDDLVLDEEFVREAGTSEPSARARMLAARWRRERPEPQPWRSDEPPAGWFFSKGRRRRRWRRG
ncbi:MULTISPECIES: SGM_3592 family protein [Streptomyces]|uniref:SGM_3592 family protein n=1 Tax=Streptomyces TaxID=1883 RepID=UPI0018855190|nr:MULTISPECIES: hypothetical protein [Streptomyces]MBF8171231.1 hypothetical protein [Streptomyces olivaceus]MBZ6132489.1 hypothetical protein [Streptomyces olivaceus]MBZ6137040.1 hypothetical protein [Streptomyces olivaceus]MBZ6164262.1 hypothetical protein [Streptomyces olivaceus]MBZ6171351.1 hypothetical protein [Streptomyces olivaceus]